MQKQKLKEIEQLLSEIWANKHCLLKNKYFQAQKYNYNRYIIVCANNLKKIKNILITFHKNRPTDKKLIKRAEEIIDSLIKDMHPIAGDLSDELLNKTTLKDRYFLFSKLKSNIPKLSAIVKGLENVGGLSLGEQEKIGAFSKADSKGGLSITKSKNQVVAKKESKIKKFLKWIFRR